MKILSVVAALGLAAGTAWALQKDKPINTTCPVKGETVKNITTTYKGKTIGFC